MKNALRRSLTGLVYVCLLLAAVFLNSDAFDFLFMSFGLACIFEYKKLSKIRGYLIFALYLLLWWAYIYLLHDPISPWILLIATLAMNIRLIVYLFNTTKDKMPESHRLITGLLYVGGGSIFLTMIPYRAEGFDSILIAGIFCVIWANDTMAYVTGSLWGKNKLFPSVSPNKTVEGAIGGLIFGMSAAYLCGHFGGPLSPFQWGILSFVLIVSGNLGDLLESKLKRAAGVKDSGAILPGHGGMLDRLDSLLFSAPWAYLTLFIFDYVS